MNPPPPTPCTTPHPPHTRPSHRQTLRLQPSSSTAAQYMYISFSVASLASADTFSHLHYLSRALFSCSFSPPLLCRTLKCLQTACYKDLQDFFSLLPINPVSRLNHIVTLILSKHWGAGAVAWDFHSLITAFISLCLAMEKCFSHLLWISWSLALISCALLSSSSQLPGEVHVPHELHIHLHHLQDSPPL